MAVEIRYGDGATLRLEMPATSAVADFTEPRGTPLSDPAAAVQAALADPLDFPSLTSAIVPGDHVVIALELGIPQTGELLAGIVKCLIDAKYPLGSIGVVFAPEASSSLAGFPSSLREHVEFTSHDPRDAGSLAYLAASEAGDPIYFNKQICDADLVLPVGTTRIESSLGYLGVHSALFPTFSDSATQSRFRSPDADFGVHQKRRVEVEEAAWLLGVQLLVQVVPGPGDSAMQIIAGSPAAAQVRGQEICNAAWEHTAPTRAQFVVASIEGGPEQQTWDNVARSLHNASQAVHEDGAILLCTELNCQPGRALMQLAACADDAQALREISRDNSADALAAATLAVTRQRASIYLLSQLDCDLVESLGIGHVGGADDIERLSTQFDSCILIGNAQHAWVREARVEGLGAGVEG